MVDASAPFKWLLCAPTLAHQMPLRGGGVHPIAYDQVATFLGKKITPQLAQELGSRFQTRIQGTCIKHRLGQAQVKMYDKVGLVLRIETTVNNVSFFAPGIRAAAPPAPREDPGRSPG